MDFPVQQMAVRAYVTCPLTASRERVAMLPGIRRIVEAAGISVFEIIEGGAPAEIFRRDYTAMRDVDIIVAEVSEPSHGVGIELAIAWMMGRTVFLLVQEGCRVSALALGIPGAFVIEYRTLRDIEDQLAVRLRALASMPGAFSMAVPA